MANRPKTKTQLERISKSKKAVELFFAIEQYLQGNRTHGSLWWVWKETSIEEMKEGARQYGEAIFNICSALCNARAKSNFQKLELILKFAMDDWRKFLTLPITDLGEI